MDSLNTKATATALLQLVQPEVQKYLEAVYAVAPVPGEYVRYRLHLATALPLDLLDAWFDMRRKTSFYSQDLNPNSSSMGSSQTTEIEKPKFSLFGSCEEPKEKVGEDYCRDAGPKPLLASNLTLQGSSEQSAPRHTQPETVPDCSNSMPGQTDSGSLEDEASAPSRFNESDLEAISSLVGLETLTSTQHHCGSTSLFLFEQLTALDSLDMEGKSGNKRRRTRHQHFWRNTDKLDLRERVYIPTSSIRPALHNNEPVVPKMDIGPDERTNAWTVCLTTPGVVSYLNKRISPLGVQVIRALQKRGRGSDRLYKPKASSPQKGFELHIPDHAGASPKAAASGPAGVGLQRFEPANQAEGGLQQRQSPAQHTESETESQQEGPKRLKHQEQQGPEMRTLSHTQPMQASQQKFEPIPRARRRKPSN